MSRYLHSDFTAWGTIEKTFRVLIDDFKFFGMLIILYVAASTLPYLYLFDGVDFSDPAVVIEMFTGSQPYLAGVTLLYYFLYAYLYIIVLDRTNAVVNGHSFQDYPYVERGLKMVIPVFFLYMISAILAGIGLLLFIIPGLIAIAGLYIVIPAKLAENINVADAIPRGWKLSKGNRLGIWGLILLQLVLILIVTFGLMFFLLGDLLTDVENGGGVDAVLSPTYLIVNSLVSSFFTIFYMAVSGVAYHHIVSEEDQ